MIQIRSNGESQEVDSDVSSRSEGDIGSREDDPLIYGMPRGIITSKRIRELVLRYRVPARVCI